MFQFLIGNVITSVKGINKEDNNRFQFLIGNVITQLADNNGWTVAQFQFLIGNVITHIHRQMKVGCQKSFNSS